MRRLWLRWALLIVFVAVLGAVFVNLGQWQLDRLDQREPRNSTTMANESRPVRPFTDVFTGEIRDADQWQRVEARGTFDAEHQFVLRYRRNGEAEGYEVVTPLRTAAGTVLVDRGFVALGRGTRIPEPAPAPPGRRGHGRRTRPAQRAGPAGRRHPGGRPDAVDQLRRHRPPSDYPLMNGYIGLITMHPAAGRRVRAGPAAGDLRRAALLVRACNGSCSPVSPWPGSWSSSAATS